MTFGPKYSDCVILLIFSSWSWSSDPQFILLTFPHGHQVSTRDEQVIVSCFESWITCCSFLHVSCCPWKASVKVLSDGFSLLHWSTARQFHSCPIQTPHASRHSAIDSFWQTVAEVTETTRPHWIYWRVLPQSLTYKPQTLWRKGT